MPKTQVRKSKRRHQSVAAYARHRGCTGRAVTKAIEAGRLRRSIIMVNGRPKIRSFAAADREWNENTRSMAKRLDELPAEVKAARIDTEVSKARRAKAAAELAELELKEKQGQLTDPDEIRAEYYETIINAKSRLLGVPAKLRQRAPHLPKKDLRLVDALIREALAATADDG